MEPPQQPWLRCPLVPPPDVSARALQEGPAQLLRPALQDQPHPVVELAQLENRALRHLMVEVDLQVPQVPRAGPAPQQHPVRRAALVQVPRGAPLAALVQLPAALLLQVVAPRQVALPVVAPLRGQPRVQLAWRQVPSWRRAGAPDKRPRAPPGPLVSSQPMMEADLMAAVETNRPSRTYGNWRRPTSAGILGLGSVGTALLMGSLILVVITVMVATLLEAVIVAGVLGIILLLVVTRDSHGKNVLARGGARAAWWAARSRGTNIYRSGPLGRTPWGTYQLPGLAAPMRLSEHQDSYGRPFALLYTPATGSYSVIIGTEPDGAALVDEDQIDVWVADWGHWLANLGDEPGVEAASVTIETAPDSGTRLFQEVELNIDPDAPRFSLETLREVVNEYPAGSSTVKAYVAITFAASPRPGGKRRKVDEMSRELATRLPGLTGGLEATGAGAAHPVSAQGLCEAIRVAYDPAAATLIDQARAAGETVELSWPDVGPAAAEAEWGGYRHDSAYSRTWAMTTAPRGNVQSGVLARLLAPHRDIARKRVTLLYRPIDAARAAAMVEADLRAAEFRVTSTTKPAARDTAAVRAAQSTAHEEASGAGLVQFGMLITATVSDLEKKADARAAIDNLAATARLRVRPVYGSQDSAFAAALPLGLVLPKHIKVPAEMRDKL